MQSVPFYRTRLLEELGQRQRKNASYSLRAFARTLGVQPPTLSAVLAGKRGLPRRSAPQLASKLGLRPLERERFLRSVQGIEAETAAAKPTHLLNEEQHYKILAEWEHYAVFYLLKTKGSKSDPHWIARRLGISTFRAREVLDRLESVGMVRRGSKGLECAVGDLRTTEDIVSQALRDAHHEELTIAAKKLAVVPPLLRDFSSVSIVTSRDRLADAKALIREFRKRFADLIETDDGTEIYQLCLQLFPLTEVEGVSK